MYWIKYPNLAEVDAHQGVKSAIHPVDVYRLGVAAPGASNFQQNKMDVMPKKDSVLIRRAPIPSGTGDLLNSQLIINSLELVQLRNMSKRTGSLDFSQYYSSKRYIGVCLIPIKMESAASCTVPKSISSEV